MKNRQHKLGWPTWILACALVASAVSADAKKPTKPPPDPPPSAGPAFWLMPLEGDVRPNAINDAGTIVGAAWFDTGQGSAYIAPFSLAPRTDNDGHQYLATNLEWLLTDTGAVEYGECIAVNQVGEAAGYISDAGPEQAMLWRADGTPVNLGVCPADVGCRANDINDAGLVLVGFGAENHESEGSGVVVPLDTTGDGEPDTWFVDLDADGINDLFFPMGPGHNLFPSAINEAGQVAANQYIGGNPEVGYLLTPDYDDADGDSNPWFADVDGDGFNDLLVALAPPDAGEAVAVTDLNNLGQVVGRSNGHVVLWEIVDGEPVVTEFALFSKKMKSMSPAGINDAGQIVGSSRNKSGFDGPSWLYQDGTFHELLSLIENAEGIESLAPSGINNQGWVCGRGFVAVLLE